MFNLLADNVCNYFEGVFDQKNQLLTFYASMLKWIMIKSKISRNPPIMGCFWWGVTPVDFFKTFHAIDMKIFLGRLMQFCTSQKSFW